MVREPRFRCESSHTSALPKGAFGSRDCTLLSFLSHVNTTRPPRSFYLTFLLLYLGIYHYSHTSYIRNQRLSDTTPRTIPIKNRHGQRSISSPSSTIANQRRSQNERSSSNKRRSSQQSRRISSSRCSPSSSQSKQCLFSRRRRERSWFSIRHHGQQNRKPRRRDG